MKFVYNHRRELDEIEQIILAQAFGVDPLDTVGWMLTISRNAALDSLRSYRETLKHWELNACKGP